jgi:ubiquinone/menaquinone biosynthesis C-methylase UbiE
METIKRWIRRAIIHRYFPEVWYSIENWLSSRMGDQMLEIGSGRGVFTNAIAKDSWSLTSIDPSQQSIVMAAVRLKDSGFRVNFQKANPEQLPFENDRFDAITCINYLEFSADPVKVLTEAMRVLKPGGKGIVVVFRSLSFWTFPWVAGAMRKDTPDRPCRCYNFQEFRTMIIRSGFSVDSYRFRARFLPLQPYKQVVPWPFAGVMIASVKKPMPGEKQIKHPARKMGLFHKQDPS